MGTLLETWIIREGTHEDYLKMQQIRKGENLESLLTDENWVIRALLAENRHFLDILVQDKFFQNQLN